MEGRVFVWGDEYQHVLTWVGQYILTSGRVVPSNGVRTYGLLYCTELNATPLTYHWQWHFPTITTDPRRESLLQQSHNTAQYCCMAIHRAVVTSFRSTCLSPSEEKRKKDRYSRACTNSMFLGSPSPHTRLVHQICSQLKFSFFLALSVHTPHTTDRVFA